jgi:hypothetical protein
MKSGATKTGQERQDNGQYGSAPDVVCTCGHTLGDHTAERPYACIIGDFAGYEICDCEKFKKQRAR